MVLYPAAIRRCRFLTLFSLKYFHFEPVQYKEFTLNELEKEIDSY